MTYEELKAAYEAAVQKCSELEKENDELKKSNEDQALHIEHLEEQILKRNKMLFGQKSEKSKFICNGQMDLDGNVFNEAEELSNLSAAEPTEDSITKKSKKTGKHRGRNELRGDLETKEIVHTLPEDQRKCAVCGSKLVPFSKEYITTRLCIIPAKIFKITYFREVYKCEHCDKHGDKIDLLIIDELSYLTFNRYQSEMLFQIISERSERASVIISTNLEFSQWTQLFENEMLLAALIDRVTFRSFVLNMNCSSSYRIDSTLNHD